MLGSARSAFVKKGAITPPAFPSPIAAYGFSEGSGTTTADSSGNGHTLTLNSASWTPSGHTGSGITNTSTTLGASTSSFTNSTGAFTLMAWVLPLDLTAGNTDFAVGFMQSDGSTNVGIFTQRNYVTPNVLQVDVRIDGSVNVVTGGALTVGTWVHVAITYDGTILRLYRDGTQVGTSSVVGTVDNGTPFYVAGTIPAAGPFDTDVTMDDVRYFNVTLTPTEVTAAMNTPVS